MLIVCTLRLGYAFSLYLVRQRATSAPMVRHKLFDDEWSRGYLCPQTFFNLAAPFRAGGRRKQIIRGNTPMPQLDPRVDAYIASAPEFAQPILVHFRSLVHQACPDVVETIKWGMPSFEYKGPYCSMVAFKKHCGFGFWKAALLDDGVLDGSGTKELKAMNWGAPGSDPIPAKVTSLQDLPKKAALLRLLKAAKKLNDEGIKVPTSATTKPKPEMPPDFKRALAETASAKEHFAKMSQSQQREYLEWILEAKRPATRAQRIATATEWIAEGKSRNWKYQK